MLGVMISPEEYEEYRRLKAKNTPMQKEYRGWGGRKYCPICNYLVDHAVPPQNYCDNCGQRLVR